MPRSWAWKMGRPWCPDWVISATFRPATSSRNSSKALRLVLGPSRWVDDDSTSAASVGLQRLAVGTHLGEAGGEDHRVPRRLGLHRLEALDGVAGEDHGEVDVVVGHGARPTGGTATRRRYRGSG